MAGELPQEAPPPVARCKTFKQLGTLTKQASQFEYAFEEITMTDAEEARERLVEAGEIDSVEDEQPPETPPLESLVGTRMEILYRYWVEVENDPKRKKRQELIWCEGDVVEVASKAESRMPAQVRKELGEVPEYRAVLIKWPADKDHAERERLQWSIVKPSDYRGKKHMAWRYSACELAKLRTMRCHARKRQRREDEHAEQ